MPIIDIIIAATILISVTVGVFRGLVKEAISIASLLIAIWAALYFGAAVGDAASSWLKSEGTQMWFGRIVVFGLILAVGGLIGWGLSKLIRLSVLSGLDRFLGSLFGAVRGIVIVALFVLAGSYAGFANDNWWQSSKLIPHFQVVAEWIAVMAPEGLDMLTPDKALDTVPVEMPGETSSLFKA